MAKRTRKRLKYNKDRSGCMWGFMNIFERHGRPTHKLLSDRKHESRRIFGVSHPSDELKKAEDEIVSEQYEKAILDKLSIKSLMMEEMFENIDSDKQSHERKKSWHANKNSFDLNDVDLVSEKPTHRKYKSLSSLEDLSSQIHVKVPEDSSIPPNKDSSNAEERLKEATRVFIHHFADGRNTEEGKMKPSRELMEALSVLNSNKEMFLQLLRDPSSELVKHLEYLEDNPVEFDSVDQGKCKQLGFFRRRLKVLDRNSSKKSRDSSTIVVLKPAIQDDEKGSFWYSLNELTRKLKLTMRKENGHMDTEELPKCSSTPELRICNIYSEAKKHLAEIVGNGDEDAEFSSKEKPESLGRILSHSNYNSSPISSPREQTADQLERDGNEIHVEDEHETQNQISSPQQRSMIEIVDDALNDFEEEKTMELDLDDVVPNRPSSPLASSSTCSTTEGFEDQETISDRSERPSPISVLEPIFIDDNDSPSSIKSFPVSEYIQPRQIKFDDQFSRARSRTWADEKNAVFEFVEAIALASCLTRDNLLEKFLFSDHLLDPSLLDHVYSHPDRHGYDPKLLFDLVCDVLSEVCVRDFDGIPSFCTLMKLTRKNLVDETRQGVDWHLQSEHTERTLDQTVAKDFSKLWTWMDLRVDSERVGVEIGDFIFDELVEEVVTSLFKSHTCV